MKNYLSLLLICIAISCSKSVDTPKTSITTTEASAITNIAAKSGAVIASDIAGPVTSRGVVWSTQPNPTIALSTKTTDSLGVGQFTSTITGLQKNTTYYVKAYAVTSGGVVYGNQVTFTTSNIDVTTGLIAYYPFNGNANDQSGNGNHGTVMGSVSLTTDRLGNANKAYEFPGNSNSYIDGGSGNSLKFSGAITMSAWLLMNGGTANPRVIEFGTEGTTHYQMVTQGTSNTSRVIDAGFAKANMQGSLFCCGFQPAGGVEVQALTWQHVVFTADDQGVYKLYVNGVLAKTGQGTVVNETNYSNPLNIGRKNLPSFDAFGGKLDDIRIYNRALTADQVAYLFREYL
ncbi:MAG: hypothetical protein RL377_1151 [Bacteroidota bacterium]